MKKSFWIAGIVLVAVLMQFLVANAGTARIVIPDGTLHAKKMGTDKSLAVLLLAGSGPTDMDGNSPLLAGRNDSLLQLATALRREGVTVMRFDKRTAGKSAKTVKQLDEMDFGVFVEDCRAVITHLRQEGYEKIVVAGHSKGSLVGMLAALDAGAGKAGIKQDGVDGFISIAGAGYPIDMALERQLIGHFGENSLEIQTVRMLRQGRTNPDVTDDNHMFSPKNQRFLLTWMKHDPATILATLQIPVLIVQGGMDTQVDRTEFEALTMARPDAATLWLNDMNHVLKSVDSDEENLASYQDPSFGLHPDLVPGIMQFLAGVSGTTTR